MARAGWITQCLCAMSAAMLLAAPVAHGQTLAVDGTPPQSVDDALHQMSDAAGVIFAGQVISVRHQEGDGVSSGFVEIEFRVDQAIRGCTAGTPYMLREWAGLWEGGAQRYRVGQQLLMFLHAPSASGMSSPVGGMDGAIPIHGSSSAFVATSSAASQYPVADLRWIGARLLRPVSYRTESVHFNHRVATPIPFVAAQSMVRAAPAAVENTSVSVEGSSAGIGASAASVSAQQTSVQAVIGMLKSWQKVQDAVR